MAKLKFHPDSQPAKSFLQFGSSGKHAIFILWIKKPNTTPALPGVTFIFV